MLNKLRKDLKKLADPRKVKVFSRFFKAGKGEYAEGDILYGIRAGDTKTMARKYSNLSMSGCRILLKSKIHEERLTALLILIRRFERGPETIRKKIYRLYIANTKFINNWDLVDVSAPRILGEYLKDRDRSVLYTLARSANLWKKRISIVATYRFIKDRKEYNDTLSIADILLHDDHDLIQKGVGWMLKEVGNKISRQKLEEFLKPRYLSMPRTTLRYAIEKFPEMKRRMYLEGKVLANKNKTY